MLIELRLYQEFRDSRIGGDAGAEEIAAGVIDGSEDSDELIVFVEGDRDAPDVSLVFYEVLPVLGTLNSPDFLFERDDLLEVFGLRGACLESGYWIYRYPRFGYG